MISLARPWQSVAGAAEHACSSERKSPSSTLEVAARCAQATRTAFSTKIWRGLLRALAYSVSWQSTCSVSRRSWARIPQEVPSACDRLGYLQRYAAPQFCPAQMERTPHARSQSWICSVSVATNQVVDGNDAQRRKPCVCQRVAWKADDTLAERSRRRPAKPMGSPRVGSNPTGVALSIVAW